MQHTIRLLICAAVLLALMGAALAQVLLGNCGTGVTGIQLSTGNIYCYPPPSASCPNSMDFSKPCNSQYGF